MTKSEILTSIYNNKLLNDAIKNIVAPKDYEDFRSHFLLQVSELPEAKLITLWKRNELDWYCLKIMTNQYKSKTSTFHKLYRNGGLPGSSELHFLDIEDYLKDKVIADIKTQHGPDPQVIKKQVLILLECQYDNPIVNNYHKSLFKLYYFDDLTLKQIELKTSINFNAVSRSVRKTKAYLKTKIKI